MEAFSWLYWYHRWRVTKEDRKFSGKLVGLGALISGISMIVNV